MKKNISLLMLLFFFQASAMNEKQSACGTSGKPYVRTTRIRKGRGTVYVPVLGFMTACSVVEIKRKGRSYVVNVSRPTREEYGFVVGFETIKHELNDAIPGNSTLWEVGPDSYDVLYRREDGVIVAKNLQNGEELYHLKHGRIEGDDQEQLVQAADGWVIATNKDGSCKTWLHQELRNRAIHNHAAVSREESE